MAVIGHRKVVTVLFCDVVGSTALGASVDPEALQGVLARYFERMKGIIESHGGSVEKFIGDAVMAVFGVPVVHEDDALRACRAAVEMRDALPALGVAGRIGVDTGEVLVGTEERLATGDAVNVAARLEQAAEPGEALIGAETLGLVAAAVEVGEKRLLELKGKRESVAAYPLKAVREVERAHALRFVGRELELRQLAEAWERTLAGPRCELVTVVGDPGVGKSRLVAEALTKVDARIVRGRCLSYGEGITYWPVVEVVKQLGALPSDEQAASAIRSLLRESDAAVGIDEIAWAFRMLLEEQAPLVVCFDDIQWGEEAFLGLVESTALLSSSAALLLVCMARPELLDRRPGWSGMMRLEPLPAAQTGELVGEAVPDEVRERIVRASGGNPLFVAEMLALAGGEGNVDVPATLWAVLAARLDQLDEREREVLERGAVEGEVFHRGAVQALAPEEPQVTPRLAALVRHRLIQPEKAQLPAEEGFRFCHILIREAAYNGLPKATRAELHARFAAWLEERGSTLVELDELVGYHLEQVCRYRSELGLADDPESRSSARDRLSAAGRRAIVREDVSAAHNLIERAVALLPEGEVDARLEGDLGWLLRYAGKIEEARRSVAAAAERAAAAGDRIGELCLRLDEAAFAYFIEPEGGTARVAALVEEALPLFEAAGDEYALYRAHLIRAIPALESAQNDPVVEAWERSLSHARRTGLPHLEAWLLPTLAANRTHSTTPVSQLLPWLDEQEARGVRGLGPQRCAALALLGRFEEARALFAQESREYAERGATLLLAIHLASRGVTLELLCGDATAAVALGEEGCRMLEEAGERNGLSSAAGLLAQAMYAADRLDEAETWARRAAELAPTDDVITQMLWRQAQAKVLARRGEHSAAQRLAREAITIAEKTDLLTAQADAHTDLAEVLSLAGDTDAAATAYHDALDRYERKGVIPLTRRTRERLSALQETPT